MYDDELYIEDVSEEDIFPEEEADPEDGWEETWKAGDPIPVYGLDIISDEKKLREMQKKNGTRCFVVEDEDAKEYLMKL